ncbi:MAG TPA: hypothetical protein PLC65_13740 [Bacteroidia bacterium]|nr:hypothetical protein [Bacteroidia bacterium]
MAFEDINFPVYRKYKNGKTAVKIISRFSFEEKQKIGTKNTLHLIEAKQLPEMNHIFDLVYNFTNYASEITENEYNTF